MTIVIANDKMTVDELANICYLNKKYIRASHILLKLKLIKTIIGET